MKNNINIAIVGLGQIGNYLYNELNSEKNDPEEIVIDEACGIIISMLFMNYVSSSSGFIDNFAHFFIALFIFDKSFICLFSVLISTVFSV